MPGRRGSDPAAPAPPGAAASGAPREFNVQPTCSQRLGSTGHQVALTVTCPDNQFWSTAILWGPGLLGKQMGLLHPDNTSSIFQHFQRRDEIGSPAQVRGTIAETLRSSQVTVRIPFLVFGALGAEI